MPKPLIECFHSSPRFSLKQDQFFDIYDEVLSGYRGRDIVLVEIGVFQGGSLFMWRDYLGPKARIIGVEANPEAVELRQEGFEIFIGDQADPEFWKRFFAEVGEIDVLIDDGGHWNDQQIKTVAYCAEHIRDGGVLIVEDTQTSYYEWMGNPCKYSFIEYAKHLVDVLHSRNTEVRKSTALPPLSRFVHSITFYDAVVCFRIDRAKCIASKPVGNGAKVMGHAAVGTDKSDYGALVLRFKANPFLASVRKYLAGIAKPASRLANRALLAANNRKLRVFFD